MTKRDILVLFFPSVAFVIIAAVAFLTAADIGRRHDVERDKAGQQQFDTFIANVQAGKQQLTTDETVEFLKRSHDISESLWQADADTGMMMRIIGWIVVGCVLLQVSVTRRVLKKLGKP